LSPAITVGDGDAVGVAAEVVEHLLWSAEGRLGVDDPVDAARRLQLLGKASGFVEVDEGSAEDQLTGPEGLVESLKEQATEQAGQHANRQEEAGPAGHPTLAIGRQPAAGDDAVQVRMVLQGLAQYRSVRRFPRSSDSTPQAAYPLPLVHLTALTERYWGLAPGVQHRDKADLGAEVTRVRRDGAQGRGRAAEQDVVDDAFVLQPDGGDRLGHGEDDMEVRHRQQISLAGFQPQGTGQRLTLGTVAVACDLSAQNAPQALRTIALDGKTLRGSFPTAKQSTCSAPSPVTPP